MKRALLVSILVLGAHSAQAQEVYLVGREGTLVRAEAIVNDQGVFLRDREVGQAYPFGEFSAIYTPDHRKLLRSASAWHAARDSFFLLGAGETYIWNPKRRWSFLHSDTAQRLTKVGLLAITAGLFYRALESNRRLASSIEYWNADGARARFHRDRSNYQTSLAFSLGYFIAQSAVAYAWFGRSIDGVDLRPTERAIGAREYIERFPPNRAAFQIELAWTGRW